MRRVEFEQGKDRDGRPTWKAYIGDAQVGCVRWSPTFKVYAFTPKPQPSSDLRAWALFEIANFLAEKNRGGL